MPADAQLTVYLLKGILDDALVSEAIAAYRDAAEGVPAASRQWHSVLSQLELLAEFFEAAGKPALAEGLRRIAHALQN